MLPPGWLLRVLSLFFLVALLATGQIYLRFLSQDLQIETRKLQKRQMELVNLRKSLVSEVERLKCYDAIRAYASNKLGMEECSASQNRQTRLSAESVVKWSRAANWDAPAPGGVEAASADSLLAVWAQRLAQVSPARMD